MTPAANGDTVGLVLAGGGARGAYEAGALSALLPALEQRGQRPRVIVGTSVGALNGAFAAASAQLPAAEAAQEGLRIWSEITYEQVLEPLWSPGSLGRALAYLGEVAGIPRARLSSLLDPAPLVATLERLIRFQQIDAAVRDGTLLAAAVAATSARSGRTVVFHHGGASPPPDRRRAIDYVSTRLGEQHVRASAAIPTLFPAVRVSAPRRAAGWHFDGGTRLNTPIKPALALGADRVVVVALNPIARPGGAGGLSAPPPDALAGAGQVLQALLVDQLVNDVCSLAATNRRLAIAGAAAADGARPVPYIFVAPSDPEAIGRIAYELFNRL